MAVPNTPKPEERKGDIEVKALKNNRYSGLYTPRAAMAEVAGLKLGVSAKMLHLDLTKQSLTIYPLITWPDHEEFLLPKYKKIKSICFPIEESTNEYYKKKNPLTSEDLLILLHETLLPGFTLDPDYGLGIAREFKDIIDAIEAHSDCIEIRFSEIEKTTISSNKRKFTLNINDYDEAKKNIRSISSLGQKAAAEVKDGTIYNMLAEKLSKPLKTIAIGRSPVRHLITAAAQGKPPLTAGDQDSVITILKTHSKQIAEAKPEALARLQDEIELVTLEVLIKKYEDKLKKSTLESEWQDFFDSNKFILTMAFGYPIVEILGQASVGGSQLIGGGSKFADFISRNSQTNNAAIFEIKTPGTLLLNKMPFRGKVYSATKDFSGAIVQILDQKYQLGKHLPLLKSNDRDLVLEAYAVHCCLIIGTTPKGLDEQKSFELFRRNSREVEIITFDELLEKLKQLHTFLSSKI
ncbi:Shedu immune nuclease family protein [Pseudomonas chlororaphis]|uniref:Shedu immune nuclease family protein n=1 Tax=Pseudomonas chlororaphis TaxID=587753 RepID=UPI001622EED1|nr:Shedu immune nuclease family protein [Pseudomonas chlororaphis]